MVGSDGETHQGVFDLSFLSSIPNMNIMAPKNKWELSDMMKFAIDFNGPIAIRYPRGEAYSGLEDHRSQVIYGKSEVIYEEEDIALLCVGSMIPVGEKIHEVITTSGGKCTLVNARFVKPIDEEAILQLCKNHSVLVTMEENVSSGGFGQKVLEYISNFDAERKISVITIAIPDEYVEHGNVEVLKREVGLDYQSIIDKIKQRYCWEK